MATISSIGVRIGILVDDVDAKVAHVSSRLLSLGTVGGIVQKGLGKLTSFGWARIRAGVNNIADGFGQLRAAGPAAGEAAMNILRRLYQATVAFRYSKNSGLGQFLSDLYKPLSGFSLTSKLTQVFAQAAREARIYGKIIWSNFVTDLQSGGFNAPFRAVRNGFTSLTQFGTALFQRMWGNLGRIGTNFAVRFSAGWKNAISSGFGVANFFKILTHAGSVLGASTFSFSWAKIGQTAFAALTSAGSGLMSVLSGVASVTLGLAAIVVSVLVVALIAAAATLAVIVGGSVAFVTAIATISYSAISATVAVSRMAREFGTSFNVMQTILQDAARSGVAANSVERWLGHMEELLGGVANGALRSQTALRLLGMDSQQLVQMNPGQAFQHIVEHLRGLPGQYERARVAAIIFGRDFRRVLDVAANPNRTTPQQQALYGMNLTGGQEQIIAQADSAMTRVRGMITGATTQIAVQAAPVFIAVIEQLDKWIEKAGGIKNIMTTVGDVVGGIMKEMGRLLSGLLAMTQSFIGYIEKGIAAALRLAAAVPGVSSEHRHNLQAKANAFDRSGGQNISQAFTAQGWGAQARAVMDQVATRARQLSSAMASNSYSAEGARSNFLRLASVLQRLTDSAGRFIHMPLVERFRDDMSNLYQLVTNGFLTNDQGSLALAGYVDELRNTLGMNSVRGPAAMNPQSQEAGSAIARLYNSSDRLDPQQRMVQLLVEASNRDTVRLQYSREIRDALTRLGRV